MDQPFVSTRPAVSVNGEGRTAIDEALSGMTVNQPLNGSAYAELTLINWGLSEGEAEPTMPFVDIGLGDRIGIEIGEESPSQIFDGEITAIEERYGEGAPQLILLAQDRLHHLARQRYGRTFDDQSPNQIVQAIAGEGGLQSDASVSTVSSTYHQLNESNLAFLFRMLSRFDIALRLEDGTLRARPEGPDSNPIELDTQDNALHVRLLSDLNHQPSEARVQGFNAATDQSVSATANAVEPTARGQTAADFLARLGWSGDEVVPQPFALKQGEAEAFAQGHFNRQAKRFVSGEISCQGEPRLRSGREIDLRGVSERLRGVYQVVHCAHRFDGQNGYETHIKVNRSDWAN